MDGKTSSSPSLINQERVTETYTAAVDQNEAIQKAKQFAQNAFMGETGAIKREHQQKLDEVRSGLSVRGMAQSSVMVREAARINAEEVTALTQARLNAILEGYELYEVMIDDQMAVDICDGIMQGVNQMVYSANSPHPTLSPTPQYRELVAQMHGVSAAWVKTQIDRRRLAPKKPEAPSITTIYNVQGDHARWNTNSTDNSVNVVTKSSAEFFTTLRERIEAEVTDKAEQKKIVEAIEALQEAHGKPSFVQRYTDFIAVAANHMTILAPFIPALTEMVHKIAS